MIRLLSLGDSILYTIFSYSHAVDLMNSSCACQGLRIYSDDESIWQNLCSLANIKQTSARARGVRRWKVLYLSYLCNECNNDGINGNGTVKVDVCGESIDRSIKITLCGKCFNSVRCVPQKDRKMGKSCNLLPKLKKTRDYVTYFKLLEKIPEFKRKNKKDKLFDYAYNNPNINDTLLRLIKR